jgi:hypothetical protein
MLLLTRIYTWKIPRVHDYIFPSAFPTFRFFFVLLCIYLFITSEKRYYEDNHIKGRIVLDYIAMH